MDQVLIRHSTFLKLEKKKWEYNGAIHLIN